MILDTEMGKQVTQLIGERRSHPRLEEPAPDFEVLDSIFSASLRAPDHMHLRPWRFLTISGDDRKHLGELFVSHGKDSNPHAQQKEVDSAYAKAFRAPLIVVGIASYKSHPKVPDVEQAIATGGVMNNIGLAAYAHGFGSVWRTGAYAVSQVIKQGLGLIENEEIIGFLYLGTPTNRDRHIRPLVASDFFSAWPNNG
jgi:nitroreductase